MSAESPPIGTGDAALVSSTPVVRFVRWRLYFGGVFLAVPALIWIWFLHEAQRQDRHIQTFVVFVLVYLWSVLWTLLLSRLDWRKRLACLGVMIGCVAVFFGGFRLREVTGDFLPIFEFRFSGARRLKADSNRSLPAIASRQDAGRDADAAANNPGAQGDFPQFLGPNRDGTTGGTLLERDWVAHPPRERWRIQVGSAWSGFAVTKDRAITLEQRGGDEWVRCYSLVDGSLIWGHSYPASHASVLGGEGPRTTPSIKDGLVYSVGATGILSCVRLDNGALVWTKDLLHEFGGGVPSWGMSGSPLVVDGAVIVCAGGTGGKATVALGSRLGETLWASGDYGIGYSSPMQALLLGEAQVVVFHASGIAGHDLVGGQQRWNHPWPTGHPHVAMPLLISTNRLMVSSGYGYGTELIEVSSGEGKAQSVERVWKSNRLKAKFANPVRKGNNVYGLDDGILACLDLNSGELRWKDGRYGHGQTLLVGEVLLVMAESGDLLLVDPVPEGLRELGRVPVMKQKTWNPPAFASPLALVRNHREAVCLELAVVRNGKPQKAIRKGTE